MNSVLFKNTIFVLFFILAGLVVASCVPKTQFDDQREQLQATQAQLDEVENTNNNCDPEAFIQMKEQAQSLDLLQQELIDRNTELSEEVARLRVFEGQSRLGNEACEQRLAAQKSDYEAQISRVRSTYDDLVKDLRKQLREKDSEISSLRSRVNPGKPSSDGATKAGSNPAPKRPAPKKP